eukprot:742152-Pleurochrysis_carterae.AAC.1
MRRVLDDRRVRRVIEPRVHREGGGDPLAAADRGQDDGARHVRRCLARLDDRQVGQVGLLRQWRGTAGEHGWWCTLQALTFFGARCSRASFGQSVPTRRRLGLGASAPRVQWRWRLATSLLEPCVGLGNTQRR